MARFTSPSSLSCESTNTDETAAHRGDSCRHPWSPLEQKGGPARQSSLARPRLPFSHCQGRYAFEQKARGPWTPLPAINYRTNARAESIPIGHSGLL